MSRVRVVLVILLLLAIGATSWGIQRFPPPDFRSGYKWPALQTPFPRAAWAEWLDVGLLVVAMSLATWIVLKFRRRWAMTALSVACLAYFGFWRAGCICPIGAIQNVSQGVADPGFYLPPTVIAFFVLPLAFALFSGRVFCAGVCWLGAAQDIVLIRPVRVPMWLQRGLRVLPWLYLGAAVFFAALGTIYVLCEYDPFIGFFRLTGPVAMLVTGGVTLALAMFVARPYCRFLCPYGALLGLLSRVSWKGATITPEECINCGLCRDTCPFGAIQPSNVEKEKEG